MTKDDMEKVFRKMTGLDRVLVIVLIAGVVVSLISLFRGILIDRQVQVEYLNSDKNTDERLIMVDIEGAVMSPGVYELKASSRIKDLLSRAGGLSEKADRVFCEKNINLAEVIKDGQKFYIPSVSDTPADAGYTEAKNTVNKVNVNTATIVQLDTLWGVGPARAETIVKNRPYGSLDDLVKKGAISKQILEKNRELIVVY